MLVVLLIATVLVAGSGLAALPSASNDLCLDDAPPPAEGQEFLQDVRGSTDLVPYGTRCTFEVDATRTVVRVHAPSAWALLAWLEAVAVLFVVAWRRRRSAWARGAALAASILGLFGLLWHQAEYTGAVMGAVVLGLPLAVALDRLLDPQGAWLASLLRGLLLPLSAVVAWTLLGFVEAPVPGVALGVLIGALLSAAAGRVAPR